MPICTCDRFTNKANNVLGTKQKRRQSVSLGGEGATKNCRPMGPKRGLYRSGERRLKPDFVRTGEGGLDGDKSETLGLAGVWGLCVCVCVCVLLYYQSFRSQSEVGKMMGNGRGGNVAIIILCFISTRGKDKSKTTHQKEGDNSGCR
ncbi:hypothetical protein QBC36DRAFT_89492 [Triangularia setosa]|uniref:Uncharacterized protein n=1 Tax=Triangularia setosa TaxID=2587417 RepID=A0AAN6VYG1_9PEZI|nr:hypothetical protein QBC36DRAFT_89492 [Podospora setosa]